MVESQAGEAVQSDVDRGRRLIQDLVAFVLLAFGLASVLAGVVAGLYIYNSPGAQLERSFDREATKALVESMPEGSIDAESVGFAPSKAETVFRQPPLWLGAVLVIAGALLFVATPNPPRPQKPLPPVPPVYGDSDSV